MINIFMLINRVSPETLTTGWMIHFLTVKWDFFFSRNQNCPHPMYCKKCLQSDGSM